MKRPQTRIVYGKHSLQRCGEATEHLRTVLSELWSMSNVCAELATWDCLKNILNNFEFMTKNHPYKTTTDFLLEVYLNTSFSMLLQNFSLSRPVIHKIQAKTHKNTGILLSEPVACSTSTELLIKWIYYRSASKSI